MKHVITIDGGVATGTSTLAKNLALALELPRIDSGSIYRAYTFWALQAGVDSADELGCIEIARSANLELPDGEVTRVNGITVVDWIDGQRIDKLHTAPVDSAVSLVSSYLQVREASNAQQRKFAGSQGVVADGRDTGTVVFPGADLKLFLTCDDQEAARRRSEADGRDVKVQEIQDRNRDDQDKPHGALLRAEDAVEIDTTNIDASEMVQLTLELVGLSPEQRPKKIARKNKADQLTKSF